jgi:pimeloyl-ACP methyl ester carboxylesterase
MSPAPAPQPLYLQAAGETAFITLHAAASETAHDGAVILCPPFGWDEVCSYRSLRSWACHLADAGYATVRLTYPSTGDSAGDIHDPERLRAWVQTVAATARWLREEAAVSRVAAVGIGFGGLVAYLGAAAAPIEDLVLWGTPARGRSFVRQLRAFSKLEATQFFEGLEPPPPLPSGEIEAGGFLLSAETVQQLEEVDLAATPLPAAHPGRVLMLERDGLPVNSALREQFERTGRAVMLAPGEGYGDMTSHPQEATPPLAVITRVITWLQEGSALAASAPAPPPSAGPPSAGPPSPKTQSASPPAEPAVLTAASVELSLTGGATVRETPIMIRQPFGDLAAVLVEPVDQPPQPLCAILLNAGAVRRIGPSRMWVETARRWAAHGVPTLRLDVEGIGDSDGDGTPYRSDGALYVSALVPQVQSALDVLQARGIGERFLLGGLCSGAYWSFHAALRDPRVCAAILINPRALIWDAGLGPARDLRALLTERFSFSTIRRVATGERLREFVRWLVATPRRRLRRLASGEASLPSERDLDTALEQLRLSGKRVLLLFSEHEPLYEEFVRSGRAELLAAWPSVTFEYVAVRDHTLRPNWAQNQAHAALDRALELELERVPSSAPAARAH